MIKRLLITIAALAIAAPAAQAIGDLPIAITHPVLEEYLQPQGDGAIRLGTHNASNTVSSTRPVYDTSGAVTDVAVNALQMTSFYDADLADAWSPAHWLVIRPETTNNGLGDIENEWAFAFTGAVSSATGPSGFLWYAVTDSDPSNAAFAYVNQTIPDDTSTHTLGLLVKKTDAPTTVFPRFSWDLIGGTPVWTGIKLDPYTGDITGFTSTVTVRNLGNFWYLSSTVTNNGTGNTSINFRIVPAASDTIIWSDADNNLTGSVTVASPQICLNQAFTTPIPIQTTDTPITTASEVGGAANGATWVLTDWLDLLFSAGGAFTLVIDVYWLADIGAGSLHSGILSPSTNQYRMLYQTSSGAIIGRDSAGDLLTGSRSAMGYVDRLVYSASGTTQRLSTYRGQIGAWSSATGVYSGSLGTVGGLIRAAYSSDVPFAIKLPIKIYPRDFGAEYTRFTP